MPPGMNKKLENVIENSFPVSIKLIRKMQEMGIEIGRRAKLADMLIRIGHSKDNDLIKNVLIRCLEEQREDGGWGTIEETLICLRFIAHFREDRNISIRVNKAIRWLFLVKNKKGGWGRSLRDRSRIPMTFRVVEDFKKLGLPLNNRILEAYTWMENEWWKDVSFSGLSYKASGILIANKCYQNIFSKEIIDRTIDWLLKDQNKDGGWGPNKYSPVGSSAVFTPLAIRALLNYDSPEIRKAIDLGLKWIIKNQQKGGQWKEHPPEDGIIGCLNLINTILSGNQSNI